MKRSALVLVAAVASSAASAQSVMDGSEAAIGPQGMAALRKLAIDALKDPFAAQLIELRPAREGWICGRANIRNGLGGYSGFLNFAANPARQAFAVAPKLEESMSRDEANKVVDLIAGVRKACAAD